MKVPVTVAARSAVDAPSTLNEGIVRRETTTTETMDLNARTVRKATITTGTMEPVTAAASFRQNPALKETGPAQVNVRR